MTPPCIPAATDRIDADRQHQIMKEDDTIRIGLLTRPHGIGGGVRCRLDHPEMPQVETPVSVRVGFSRSFATEVKLLRCSPLGPETMLCILEGSGSRESAETFIDKALYLPKEAVIYADRMATPELIGYRVVDQEDEDRGEVVGIIKTAGHPVWEVRDGTHSWMLPAVEEFVVGIDQEEEVIRVVLIPGLYDPSEDLSGTDGERDE